MQTRYKLLPEIAGRLRGETLMDRSVHPPRVYRVHYVFDDWLGDDLLESFPCYIVSERLYYLLSESGLSGFEFDQCQVSASHLFQKAARQWNAPVMLPRFYWLRVHGIPGKDDFWISEDNYLMVSQKALEILRRFQIAQCQVIPVA